MLGRFFLSESIKSELIRLGILSLRNDKIGKTSRQIFIESFRERFESLRLFVSSVTVMQGGEREGRDHENFLR